MSKNVWDTTVPLKPVETSGGGKIVQDFFGLHDTKAAEQATITALATGTRAQNYLDETERQGLNFGKTFSGHLVKVNLRHLTVYIANHREHGPCLYVAQKTSHQRSEVEIFVNCRIPDDCIDSKRYPLFMARAVLQELIESLQSTQGVKPC